MWCLCPWRRARKGLRHSWALSPLVGATTVRGCCPHPLRIMELFRLEKPSQTIQSNCSHSTAKATANPWVCPQVPHPHICASAWQLSWWRSFSLYPNLNLPWHCLGSEPFLEALEAACARSLGRASPAGLGAGRDQEGDSSFSWWLSDFYLNAGDSKAGVCCVKVYCTNM